MSHRPRRRFGQNFLVRRDAIERIVAAAERPEGTRLVEIGPGRGALTEPLIDRFGRLEAIEVDRDLAAELTDRFGERLSVHVGDILEQPLPGRLSLVGNLPYNVSKPISMRLFEIRTQVEHAVLMFQREVADKLHAAPATSEYGPLSVLLAHAFQIETLFRLGPDAFRPRPKVDSSVTRWRPRPDPIDALEAAALKRLLRAAFAHRRKRLAGNLAAIYGDRERAAAALRAIDLDPDIRAERLTPPQFLELARRTL